MKKLLLLSMLLLTGMLAFAQRGGGDREARIQKKLDHMTTALNLDAKQQAAVKNLLMVQTTGLKVEGKKKSEWSEEERKAFRAKREATKADFDSKMTAILTPEQNETYKNLPKRDGKRGAHHAKRDHAKKNYKDKAHRVQKDGVRKTPAQRTQGRVDRVTKQLGLSAAQQKQMTDLMSSQEQKPRPAGKDFKDMTETEREAFKADRKAFKESYRAKFEEILTPEQLATYKKLKSERKSMKGVNRSKDIIIE